METTFPTGVSQIPKQRLHVRLTNLFTVVYMIYFFSWLLYIMFSIIADGHGVPDQIYLGIQLTAFIAVMLINIIVND